MFSNIKSNIKNKNNMSLDLAYSYYTGLSKDEETVIV